jgi:hypothetical protein|tara:strand:+ start:330 stop:2003 length:1674 start_codon:yes stop_codon:yes gene_type:complete
MAFNPVDFLKNLVPDDANMFGASPNANMRKMAEMGLLGDANYKDMLAKANKQSVFQGLLNTGLAYAAQPKNQGYGSIFPYLAKAGLAGVQAAQSPFDRMGKDAMMNQQLEEMKRAKDLQGAKDLFRKNYPLTGGTTQIDPNQEVPLAPFRTGTLQDDTIGSSLMTGKQYNQPRINGMPIPNEVAPMFDVINTSPMDALNRGVSQDQLSTTEIAPDSELVRAEQAYKAGVIKYPELMATKASLAKTNEFGSASADNLIFNKSTGEVTREGKTNKSQVLSEVGLQNFEKTQGYKTGFYPRVDSDGKPYIYQFNKEGKLDVTDIGGSKGFSFTLNDKKDQGLSEVAIADLVTLRDDHTRARRNLPKIDAVVTSLIKDKMGLDAGVYTGAFANFKLEADKFQAAVRNIKQKNPTIPNTEILDMALNSDVFPLIKELGIGARGLDTPAERDFLIAAMVGSKTMSSEALIQATLTRRSRLINTAREFNESSGSDLFKRASKQGVRGLSKKYQMSEEMLRGPMIDVSTYNGNNTKWSGKKIYKYADGTMVWADTGEMAYQPKGF